MSVPSPIHIKINILYYINTQKLLLGHKRLNITFHHRKEPFHSIS